MTSAPPCSASSDVFGDDEPAEVDAYLLCDPTPAWSCSRDAGCYGACCIEKWDGYRCEDVASVGADGTQFGDCETLYRSAVDSRPR